MIDSVSSDQPIVYVITGPDAADRAAVARMLASQFERSVLLDGGFFQRCIVSGEEEPPIDHSTEESVRLPLRHRLAAAAADTYVEAGFTVVVEDLVDPSLLGEFRTRILSRPCHVIVLLPSLDPPLRREVDQVFPETAVRVGIWLDPTGQAPEQTVQVILGMTRSRRSLIVVSDYDPDWPGLFAELAGPVARAVEDLGATVEHVGSTSVPGLAAKPIIDLDVVVPTVSDVPIAIERLRALGYVYQGDKGLPGRDAFLWPPGAQPHHLYVVVADNQQNRDRIDFRDYLRRHPEAVKEYGQLKKGLAAEYGDNPTGYTDAKSDFVRSALAAARRESGPGSARPTSDPTP